MTKTMKLTFFLLSIVVFVHCSPFIDRHEDAEIEWQNFKETYGRQYLSDDEEQFRKQIFMDNYEFIKLHNHEKFEQGLSSFSLGINEFADMTSEEFRRFRYGLIVSKSSPKAPETYSNFDVHALSAEVDWTKRGVVTPIKNQGNCGACWAFSAVVSIEGQHALKTGHLVSLSEQELVDCSKAEGNFGCLGGYPNNAFKFVIHNHGIDTEQSYPYVDKDEKCRKDQENKTVGATIRSYANVKSGDELALQSAVANIGPISVGIDASSLYFRFYKSGVYDNSDCGHHLNHGVAVVGYGTLEGKQYWKVKNSWGINWGLDGYILMSRNKNNQCGIANNASYPIV